MQIANTVLNSTNKTTLKNAIDTECGTLGFDKFALFAFQPGFTPTTLFSDDFPLDDYVEERLFTRDPILYQAVNTLRLFTWDTEHWPDKLTAQQQMIFDALQAIGVRNGLSIPVRAPHQKFYVLCMSLADTPAKELLALVSERHQALQTLGLEACAALEKIEKPSPIELPQLSQREIECLYWVSEGKTTWETAQILGITERTANFHFSNIMAKLNTHSKHHAAIKAISLGLLVY